MHKDGFSGYLTDFGIVIPTLGMRLDYLQETIRSLPSPTSGMQVVLVAPEEKHPSLTLLFSGHSVTLVRDLGKGLANAINQGVMALPSKCTFVAWIGDDDMLNEDVLPLSLKVLRTNDDYVATFGDIELIDREGRLFKTFRTSQGATKSIFFAPNKVPQPGSIVRRSAFNRIGGLDEEFRFSFDSDMFMRLSKIGKIHHIPLLVAKFRWHPDSLSAGQSGRSIREASQARLKNLPFYLRVLATVWEAIHVKIAISMGENSFDRALRHSRRR